MKSTLLTNYLKSAGILLTISAVTWMHLPLSAQVNGIDENIKAHRFMMRSKNNLLPIVGVESGNRVIVELPDKSRKVMGSDPHELKVIETKMAPVGRITICGTQARSERETRIGADVVAEMTGGDVSLELGETVFNFEIVADRDVPEAYVVLFLFREDRPDDVEVDFGRVGDMKAGEIVTPEIFFPNTTVSEGMAYRFEFYSLGNPLDMYVLDKVVTNPASKVLLIPWERRLKCYLQTASKKKTTDGPHPWKLSIRNLKLADYKARGGSDLKLKLRVKANGLVELVEGDSRLTPDELAQLRKDINQWNFFPDLKKGKPHSKLVTIPLKI